MVKTLTDPSQIANWLAKNTNLDEHQYEISPEGIVNVFVDCYMNSASTQYLAVKFGVAEGDFILNIPRLKSLINAPHTVGKDFRIYSSYLENLVGAPRDVGGSVVITDIQHLSSLEGFPSKVGESIMLYKLPFNSSQLHHLPRTINASLRLEKLWALRDLKGLPDKIKMNLTIRDIMLSSLEGFNTCGGQLILDYQLRLGLLRCLGAKKGVSLLNIPSHLYAPHDVPVDQVEQVLNEFKGQGKAAALKAALALKNLGQALYPDAEENMLQHNARW